MKKILIIIVAMFCGCAFADAQIKVVKQQRTGQIFSAQEGDVAIYVDHDKYYLSLSNIHGGAPCVIRLGRSKEEAMESVSTLCRIAYKIKQGECYIIKTQLRKYKIRKGKKLKSIEIYTSGHSRYAQIDAAELTSMNFMFQNFSNLK